MIKRSTWAALAIFLVLVGVATYWQRSPKTLISSTQTPTPFPNLLPDWDDKGNNLIEISNSGENTFTIELDPSKQWNLESPADEKIAQGKIEELFTTLKTATIIAQINSPVDLAAIGLQKPRLSLRLQTAKGDTVTIKVGDKTPTDSGYYVQVNENLPVVLKRITVEDLLAISNKNSLLITTPVPEGSSTAKP